MIKIESIIKNLNNHLVSTRSGLGITSNSHIVLHKTILNDPTFKVYKEYNITVYHINGKNKEVIISIKETHRNLLSLLDIGYNRLLQEVFNLLVSDKFNNILNDN